MKAKKNVAFCDKVITPQDFINMLMELYTFESHLENREPSTDFEFESFKDNPPRSIRYKRLYAILKVYGIFKDLDLFHPLHSFIHGEFIKDSYIPDPDMDNKLEKTLEVLGAERITYSDKDSVSKLDPYYLKECYKALMQFRMGLERSDHYFWGYLIMDRGTRHAGRIVYGMKEMFVKPMKECLDEILRLFLTADAVRPYTVGELIDNYLYPKITDEKLSNIDVEWM